MRKKKNAEKEYKKKHFFVEDDDYAEDYETDDDEEIDEEDDDADEDGDDIEDDDEETDSDEDYEDDDSEEEDDYDEEEDDSGWSSEDEKRARRRARRIRNQILAYAAIIFLIAGALGGAFLGGRKLVQKFRTNEQEEEQREGQQEQLEDLLKEGEPVVGIGNTPEGAEGEDVALSPLDEIVMARIAEMPLADRVAALFIVAPEQITGVDVVTRAGDATKEALTTYKVGGIVYSDKNITGADQLKDLLKNTALLDETLFLAVNEEGGENSVVASKLNVTQVPDMASVNGADGARQAGEDTGAYLAEYGFNLNLAPVADVKTAEDSILGNRSFGSDAGQVGEQAAAYVQGLTGKGVSACVKTFPGLGSVTESTAEGMADTARSQSEMESVEFPAYQAGIAAGSEFVMVGTISAPAIAGDNTPCCLSSAVIGLLRNNLGYDGIVITGALNEASIIDYHTSAEAAEKALRAGADMLYLPENFKEAYEGLLQAAEADEALQSRIEEALLRIYRVKYKDKV